jgi:hypothetical protein
LNSDTESQTITKECNESNRKQPIGYHFRDYLYLGDRINRNGSNQIITNKGDAKMNVYRVTIIGDTYYDVLCDTIAEAVQIAQKRTMVKYIKGVVFLTQILYTINSLNDQTDQDN